MKKFYSLLIFLVAAHSFGQIINFPDANFKAKLLSASPSNTIAKIYLSGTSSYVTIDTNNNGEIEVNEAALINYLDVSNSNIASLIGIEGFTSLKNLYCAHNQLTSLVLNGPDLSGIFYVDCSYNQLTSFDFSQVQYHFFWINCNNNQIASLDVSQMSGSLILSCSNNPLTNLNFQGYHKLEMLGCENTLLTSLDISGNPYCESLNCSNNPNLVSLMIKDAVDYDPDMGDMWYYFDFSDNPNLQYLCVSESRLAQAQAKLNTYGYTNCALNSYCNFDAGMPFYTIQGSNKLDRDGNGCDAADQPFPNLRLGITNGNISGTIPMSNGIYSTTITGGTHTVTPILENASYYTITPASYTVNFPSQVSPFTQDFCITPNGSHPDIELFLFGTNTIRPGGDVNYSLQVKNKGTTTQSGSVTLAFDDAVQDFISSNPVADSQSMNTLTWNFTGLEPFQKAYFNVVLHTNTPTDTPPVNSGDIVTLSATANSPQIDETPADNNFTLNQTVVNSFDPNDKTCLEGNTVTPEMIGKYIHYLIRFENSGTAEAHNIVVKDIIDTTKFDLSSLVPLQSSHEMITRFQGNKVEFIFENINLPFDDANNDGYVAFKIKTKPNLVLGDTFSNTASIYFDYNFPIVTNTATTTVALLANQDFEFADYFRIYPNPAKDILNIEPTKNIEVKSISIYNTLGQILMVIPNAQQTKAIDVSSLKTGNYFVKMNTDKGSTTAKFVKL